MLAQLDQWIAGVGWVAYLVLGLCSMLEYLFPPFPGDTVTLLGGVYAVRGHKPWVLVLLVLTLGSVLGAMVDYWIGARVFRWVHHRPSTKRFLWMSREQLLELEARMRQRGGSLILMNRFLPGVRGLLFFAAGAAQMPFGRVVGLGAISASVFNLLVLGVGYAVGGNAERLEHLLRDYEKAVGGLLLVGAVALLLRLVLRRKPRTDAGLDPGP